MNGWLSLDEYVIRVYHEQHIWLAERLKEEGFVPDGEDADGSLEQQGWIKITENHIRIGNYQKYNWENITPITPDQHQSLKELMETYHFNLQLMNNTFNFDQFDQFTESLRSYGYLPNEPES